MTVEQGEGAVDGLPRGVLHGQDIGDPEKEGPGPGLYAVLVRVLGLDLVSHLVLLSLRRRELCGRT